MRKLTLFLASAAVVAAAAASPAGATGGTRVPLSPILRGCDFGPQVHPVWGISQPVGYGEALFRTSGNTVTAEIDFTNSSDPGERYDVVLIQFPRPSNEPCGPGAPGTAHVVMVVDAGGRASATVQDSIHSGSTGAWLRITRPSPHAQEPAEAYASAFLAKI